VLVVFALQFEKITKGEVSGKVSPEVALLKELLPGFWSTYYPDQAFPTKLTFAKTAILAAQVCEHVSHPCCNSQLGMSCSCDAKSLDHASGPCLLMCITGGLGAECISTPIHPGNPCLSQAAMV
jgi:hypothetical protein